MASIDKIYGTQDQYDELKNWLTTNKEEALKYIYRREDTDRPEVRSISNFPEEIDMWLLENCSLTWVTDRIKEQYNIEV